ncbi:MAG: hypothetical protein R3333_12565 [Lishizhenia sp.]|nr:hypothetical protein [Lishizhenia sp.]
MQTLVINTRPILPYWITLMGTSFACIQVIFKFVENIETALSLLIVVVVMYLGHLFAKFLFDGKLAVTFSKHTLIFNWQRKPVITKRVFQEISIKDIQSYVYHDYRGYITVKIKMTDGSITRIECPSPSNLKHTDLGKLLSELKIITKRNG